MTKKVHANEPYRQVLTTQLNRLVSSAKWLSVHLPTKWLWIRIPLLLLKLQIWRLLRARSSLNFGQTTYFGFTLRLVRYTITTYSQMHRRDKYAQYSSIILLVWQNG